MSASPVAGRSRPHQGDPAVARFLRLDQHNDPSVSASQPRLSQNKARLSSAHPDGQFLRIASVRRRLARLYDTLSTVAGSVVRSWATGERICHQLAARRMEMMRRVHGQGVTQCARANRFPASMPSPHLAAPSPITENGAQNAG